MTWMELLREFAHESWVWVQRNSSGLSVVLSLVGFAITWLQLARTRNAAISAQEASDAALRAVGRTDTISDLAALQAGYREVQVALRGKRYETALLRAQILRDSLARVRTREPLATSDRQLRIQKMVTDLRKLQDSMEHLLESDGSTDFSAAVANKSLSDATAEVNSWMEELRFTTEGHIDDSR
jgi:hypothetical protein